MTLLPLAALTAISCCLPVFAQETETAPRPEARFGWPVPTRVRVTDTVHKDGADAKTRYVLELTEERGPEDGPSEGEGPAPETERSDNGPGNLRLRYSDFEFLEVNGQDATTPRMRRALDSALFQASAIPDLRIDPDGHYLGATGIAELLDRVIVQKPGRSEADKLKLRRTLAAPQFEQLMQTALAKYWNAWVGTWVDWSLHEGEVREGEDELVVPGGSVPVKFRWTDHGPAEGAPGHVRLSYVTRGSGKDVAAAFLGIARELIDTAGLDRSDEPADFDGTAAYLNRVEVVTRLRDLRPLRVETELDISIEHDGESHGRVERHTYEFDWDFER